MSTKNICGFRTLAGTDCQNPINPWSKVCAAGHTVNVSGVKPDIDQESYSAATSGTVDFDEYDPYAGTPPMPEDECDSIGLTPRNWAVLYIGLLNVADGIRDDVNTFGSRSVAEIEEDDDFPFILDTLPHQTHKMDETWRLRLAQAADDLKGDMDGGRWPRPHNVGEEAVLHLAFTEGCSVVELGFLDSAFEGLPSDPYDGKWDDMIEVLFQDDDYRMIFEDPRFDGAEDPNSEIGALMGTGSYEPKMWFASFNNMPERDPR